MQDQVKIQEAPKAFKNPRKLFKSNSSESDQFELEYHKIKKLGLPVNKKKLTIGNWTPQENHTYLKFLIDSRADFINEKQRRKNKVFYRLSKILKRRTPDQCRSHHQKLQMKFEDNIDQIIDSIQKKLWKKSPQVFNLQAKKMNQNIRQRATGTGQTQVSRKKQIQIIDKAENGDYQVELRNKNQICLVLNFERIQVWNPYSAQMQLDQNQKRPLSNPYEIHEQHSFPTQNYKKF